MVTLEKHWKTCKLNTVSIDSTLALWQQLDKVINDICIYNISVYLSLCIKNFYTYCSLYNFYFQWVLDKSYESSHRLSDMAFVFFCFFYFILCSIRVCVRPFQWICIALKQVSRFWFWFWFYLRRLSHSTSYDVVILPVSLSVSHISCLFLSLTFVSFTSL